MGEAIQRVDPTRPSVVVGSVSVTTPDEVKALVGAAGSAQPGWADTPLATRSSALLAAADALRSRQAEWGDLLARELGKVRADAAGEIGFAAAFIEHCVTTAPAALADRVVDVGAGRLEITSMPYGVVAAVTPWNAPVILTALKLAPALIAGNAVVVKPSPLVPLTVTALVTEVARHLPAGLLSVANGDVETARALVTDGRVAKVAFTGGGTVAASLLHDLADNLTPAMLELGGNDPAIVCADADLSDDAIERLVFGTFLTSGQVCMAAKRLYVHRSRVDELVARYVAVARHCLVIGDPLLPDTTVGPLASPQQVGRVASLVERCGGDVVELGAVPDPGLVAGGWFVRPTLVLGLDDDAELVTTEQFGPTVPLLVFDDEDEVVARANASDLGLAASVWSADVDRAFALGRRLHCGTVFVNAHNRSGMHLRAPFGGVKASGYGREFGDDAVAHYVQTRSIHHPAPSSGAGRQYPT